MLKQIDKELFESIRIDYHNIFVRKQKYLLNEKVGIYNQLKDIFGRTKGKAEAFDEYLANWGNVTKLNSSVISEWENALYRDIKPNFYAHMFRVVRVSPTKIDIYARTNGDNVLDKLCSSTDSNIYKTIKNYCEFWEYANLWCSQNEVINPADIPLTSIKSEFRVSLMSNLIPAIKDIDVLSNSNNRYCLAYYDLEQGDLYADTPAWDNFIRQMVNDECRDTYRAWVYSLFKGDNYGRQVLWIQGMGDSGKTVQANVLFDAMKSLNPDIVTSLEAIDNMDKFSLATYQQKRFALAADSTDRALIRNNVVKNLTGDDTVAVREMGRSKDYARVHCKIMVTSNKTPFVNIDSPEELSRLILISLVPENCVDAKKYWYANHFTENWSSCLKKELPDFIKKCKEAYHRRLKPDGNNLENYEGHYAVLETSKYFIARDIPVWWDNCIEKTDNKVDVIKISDLTRDYERFLRGEMWVDSAMRWMIKSSTVKFLREQKIPITEMSNFNTIFLVGYKFKEPDPKLRAKANQVILDMLNKDLGND